MFESMMVQYEDRTYALYETIESKLDERAFAEINTPEDMDGKLYKDAQELLLTLKNTADVLYLYTAKVNGEGQFVYVVDGLELYEDFRKPNDAIEDEITYKMYEALGDNPVMPDSILKTEWGEIFIAYLPFHDMNGDVIGVLGVEYDASGTYAVYNELKRTVIVMLILIVLVAVILSNIVFKRISNPLYMDKHTRDIATGMKNRNAYEVDVHNMKARGTHKNACIVVADINGLKEVNDRLGHASGDNYINLVAECINSTKSKQMISYRTGGDEFVVIMENADEKEIREFIHNCSDKVKNQKKYSNMRCSLACGYSMFNESEDYSIEDTYHKADVYMYKEKRRQKEEHER